MKTKKYIKSLRDLFKILKDRVVIKLRTIVLYHHNIIMNCINFTRNFYVTAHFIEDLMMNKEK